MGLYTTLQDMYVHSVRIESINTRDQTICKDMSESITWTKTRMTHCYGRSFPSGQMGPTAADGAEEGLLNILGQSLIHTSHEIRLWAHDRVDCK
ncbi:hypothetical protein CGCSCA4_v014090 [Colletotrichum siamense]|uniref:Uncharacterized protein n=1 Tax=Colletotrichum siamense TaxID=690259 RepID=A0A9P5BL93_COLSI|nr:uncharacterized protein CGCS363_v001160 [Colletotrichum siamense]KAF4816992.1 hypothetical protein CGCSCA5_v006186 [Colletotrichum siamense]KAF4831057.1 hypothetical protein CGCSCA4_v014090 [Colletotrichum siamense]KAF4841780.1 hypothetical protein CGCSCA2_v014786 [Colletotrichum siamense]KAF4867523.1 hypothetical protein CGCSCA1_v013363 [Colletotrichum siamense]KAF5516845.1 hypothetical protein CGCS363_v001160 [Colletotrichum siamense]